MRTYDLCSVKEHRKRFASFHLYICSTANDENFRYSSCIAQLRMTEIPMLAHLQMTGISVTVILLLL